MISTNEINAVIDYVLKPTPENFSLKLSAGNIIEIISIFEDDQVKSLEFIASHPNHENILVSENVQYHTIDEQNLTKIIFLMNQKT